MRNRRKTNGLKSKYYSHILSTISRCLVVSSHEPLFNSVCLPSIILIHSFNVRRTFASMLDCRINYKHDALKNDGQTLHFKRYDKKGIELSKKKHFVSKQKDWNFNELRSLSHHTLYLQHGASDNYMMIIQS